MSDGGKGSARRPQTVSEDEFSVRWNAIFGKSQKSEQDARIKQDLENLDQAFKDLERWNSLKQSNNS